MEQNLNYVTNDELLPSSPTCHKPVLSAVFPVQTKVLNLYAGIGGNRKSWKDCQVTAVELNPVLAKVYQDYYPDDTVIVADAHQYLLNNFQNFDFIWSSPPCQSHSSIRQNLAVRYRGTKPVFADLKLYEEIIFLQHNAKSKWVVENVNPYYKPLIEGQLVQRHLFWSNFNIPKIEFAKDVLRSAQISDLEKHLGYDLSNYKLPNKRQILRNCVYPDLGLHVFQNGR